MVFYFASSVNDPPATIYVGKDKFESLSPAYSPPCVFTQADFRLPDEELIKFGWDCDVW